ncbi:acetate--CoA ligase family protein [Chloroflexota bacterium]
MSTHPLEEIFHPKSIAVVGASGGDSGMGFFLTALIEHGFKGKIYPVNPKHSEIMGVKAYPSVKDIPEPFDYAIFAIPASEVLESLEECAQKGVKAVHLFTARFSESGRSEAAELEQAILRKVKEWGIRLIGPNCMGMYNPKEGISFTAGFPRESGSVALISQSGGLVSEIIQISATRGIRFSKAISYGNAIDLNESDFLDYFAHDPDTKMILMYVEGIKGGKSFFAALKQAASVKPVIILKGGRGQAGSRAIASHTASLAGPMQTWKTAVKQAGAIAADSIDDLVDLAVSFYFLPPIKGRKAGVVAGAGGASVLAADICEEAGLDVIPLPGEIREELKENGVLVWDWINNPVDFSIIYGPGIRPNNLLRMMASNPNFDLIIASLTGPRARQEEFSVDRYLQTYKSISSTMKPLLALVPDRSPDIKRVDDERWKMTCEITANLVTAKIPYYPNIGRAARAAGKLIDYYQRRD